MEQLEALDHPPDTTALTQAELRQWEAGTLSLDPEQLVGALALQRELYVQEPVMA